MRRRLITTYLALLAAVLLALELPLAANLAAGLTQEMVIDRLLDANRIGSIAEPALRDGQTVALAAELARYHDLYGIAGAVADRDGNLVVVTGDPADFRQPVAAGRLRQALAGDRADGDTIVWPWQTAPLAVAVPVTSGGEVIGAVVTLSPTDGLRSAEIRSWSAAGAASLVPLALFIVVAVALTRWILRPVRELDDTALRVAAGVLDARVPADLGPPELRHLARSFNEMADNVADSLSRQRAFVAQASHQLRNPLTSLRIRVDNLTEFVTETGREEHRLALEETDRLGLILDGLLALAKAERGKYRLVGVDAAAIADQRVTAWQPLAGQRGITLRRTGKPAAHARAVVTAVDQALDALIDNALKFSGPGATVLVDVGQAKSSVEIHVVDDGPGLSYTDRCHATEKFWRAPDTQNIDGAGLGLPIVSVLVEASGGRLRLLPTYPKGLDAALSFPTADTLPTPRIASA